jgi:hypothetical protein
MRGDNETNKIHQVAIVVLVEHVGYDAWDAAHAAEAAVNQVITGKQGFFLAEEVELPALHVGDEDWPPGVVKNIMPLNNALGNGLLKITPGPGWGR